MTAPFSTDAVTGGGTIALGTITVSGSILGLHFDALLIGFLAALIVLLHQRPEEGQKRTPASVFAFVAGGAFAAGLLSPIASVELAKHLQSSASALRPACAAAIAVSVHVVLPALRQLLPAVIARARAIIGGGNAGGGENGR